MKSTKKALNNLMITPKQGNPNEREKLITVGLLVVYKIYPDELLMLVCFNSHFDQRFLEHIN